VTSRLSLIRRFILRRPDLIAGLTGMLIGSLAGFGLIVWGNRTSPIIVYGVSSTSIALEAVPRKPSWCWTWVDKNSVRIGRYSLPPNMTLSSKVWPTPRS
jgi:hypothetical protein